MTDLATDHTWSLHAMSADERGPWAVLEKKMNNVSSLVIADQTGEVASLVGGLANTGGIQVAPITLAGKRCIALHFFDEKFRFICEGGLVDEMPPLELGGKLSALLTTDGVIHVFGQNFAAYAELRRGSGWGEIEKFENSVSNAEDAVVVGGGYATCFRATGSFVAMDVGGADNFYGPDKVKWCRLVPGSDLGVLTDLGMTTFAANAFGAWQPTGIDVRPLAIGRAAMPFAIVKHTNLVELQPLPTGTPTMLRTIGSSETVQAATREDRVYVTSMKSMFVSGVQQFQLLSSTRCAAR